MRRFAWTRILSVLLVLCMVASVVSMGVPAALAADETDAQAEGTELKYFPVTLYNYDDRINNATHELDTANDSVWEGIYFGGNGWCANVQTSDSYTYQTGEATYSESKIEFASRTSDYSSYANSNYFVLVDGEYKLITDVTCNVSYSWRNGYTYNYTITYKDGSDSITGEKNSYNSTYTYSTNIYQLSSGETVTKTYANWSKWTGDFDVTDQDKHGNKTYSGLVEPNLDANKNIVFTKVEGGIFNDDATVKDIYTNVGLPFIFKDGYYTFDANVTSAYFPDKPASNMNLSFFETAQRHDFSAQDGRTQGWFPFNNTLYVTTTAGSGNADYFYGMNATLPFTMNANGRVIATDDESAAITFDFSGDDDVWVFIDGVLVLDIGGIRNGMNATINFAENTWEITPMTPTINGEDRPAQDVNGAAMSGYIFTQDGQTGRLSMDRATFAATDAHELTVFYMERGAGSSNCEIRFNLPVKDTITVTKRAEQSISDNGELSDLTAGEQAIIDKVDFGFTLVEMKGNEPAPVANATYNLLNANGQVISNPSTDQNGHFYLKNGQSARFVTALDAADGVTYYVVEDSVEAMGFLIPKFTYSGTAENGFVVGGTAYDDASGIPKTSALTSAVVTIKGDDQSEDSVVFVCENYMDEDLPNPGARPVDDRIVIDFGLDVEIDVLENDVFRGDSIEIIQISGAGMTVEKDTGTVTNAGEQLLYGTASIENGKIVYKLNKQLTGVEVLTYLVKVTGTSTETATGIVKTAYEYAVATVYIMPATSMYYEENFSGLVTTNPNGAVWSPVGTPETAPQEPGKVGDNTDSPYGSDEAYLNDSGDSNGSSKYVNTTNGAAQFVYTFTGTGTSFFARTSNNTAYLRIRIYDADGNPVYASYLDTVYKTDIEKNGVAEFTTLYNVPVFTWNVADGNQVTNGELSYGTYTVEVTVAKKTLSKDGSTILYHSDFWLDGIRVFEPLNPEDTYYEEAKAAYNRDAEANMTNITLRDKILNDADIDDNNNPVWAEGDNFVLFTDVNGEMKTAEEYKSIGPKEEVYLYGNKVEQTSQTVSFSLVDWDPNTYHIYLGIKAPTGNGIVEIGSTQLTIKNAADCYYDISAYGTITEETINGDTVKVVTFDITSIDGLISLTNIKVTGDVRFAVIPGNDEYYEGSSGQNP